MMTGVAIKQHQFREHAVASALRVGEDCHGFGDSKGLPDRPGLGTIPDFFSFAVVFVDDKMLRCNFGERVELKTHAWMPRTHDPMSHQLVFIAVMAGHAQLGAGDSIRGGIHAVFDVLGVLGGGGRGG